MKKNPKFFQFNLLFYSKIVCAGTNSHALTHTHSLTHTLTHTYSDRETLTVSKVKFSNPYKASLYSTMHLMKQ